MPSTEAVLAVGAALGVCGLVFAVSVATATGVGAAVGMAGCDARAVIVDGLGTAEVLWVANRVGAAVGSVAGVTALGLAGLPRVAATVDVPTSGLGVGVAGLAVVLVELGSGVEPTAMVVWGRPAPLRVGGVGSAEPDTELGDVTAGSTVFTASPADAGAGLSDEPGRLVDGSVALATGAPGAAVAASDTVSTTMSDVSGWRMAASSAPPAGSAGDSGPTTGRTASTSC